MGALVYSFTNNTHHADSKQETEAIPVAISTEAV